MAAALQTSAKFRRLADSHKVDEIVAAATSATREAENGGDFIAEVDRQTGIRIRVISGTEEARLIHLAAGYGVDVGGTTAVVIDIGGGSVEVTLGTATQLTPGTSFKVGVIRLTERFVQSRSALRPRRAPSGQAPQPRDGQPISIRSRRAASTASSARPARS